MSNEEIKDFITAQQPSSSFDETGEWLNVKVEPSAFKDLATSLFQFRFNYLFSLTCIDWKTHLEMVYHMTSTEHRTPVVIKIILDREAPKIETVCDLWKTAEFHEREVAELFGVVFNGHPDPRKLILTDDFEGFPLRKDFEDPINMIKL